MYVYLYNKPTSYICQYPPENISYQELVRLLLPKRNYFILTHEKRKRPSGVFLLSPLPRDTSFPSLG